MWRLDPEKTNRTSYMNREEDMELGNLCDNLADLGLKERVEAGTLDRS